MKRRILGLLLALCMVLSLLPPVALATEATENPTEVVLEMYSGTGSNDSTATTGVHTRWEAAPNTIYYATTNASGVVTDLGTTDPGDGKWNIKLDNTKTVAELTLSDANVKAGAAGTSIYINGQAYPDALSVSGAGALKIIIDGTAKANGDSNCTIYAGYGDGMILAMEGGTTITSVGDCRLSATAAGSGGFYGLNSTYDLTLNNANVYVQNGQNNGSGNTYALNASKNLTVKGGNLYVVGAHKASSGIYAGGILELDAKAEVTVNHYAGSGSSKVQYGVYAAGDIKYGNAKLVVIDTSAGFDYAINKMPNTEGVVAPDKVVQKSGSALDGSDATEFVVEDPAAAYEAAYVSFEFVCGKHEYDNDEDITCNKCGEKRDCPEHKYDDLYTDTTCNVCGAEREVPKDITATFGGVDTWNVAPGQIYYATASGGAIANAGVLRVDDSVAAVPEGFTALDKEPDEWNIKLDNTKAVAELTFKDASITYTQDGATGLAVSGKGALKVLVDGGKDSKLEIHGTAFNLSMENGATITSVNNEQLYIYVTNTAGYNAISSTSSLVLDNANLKTVINGNASWCAHAGIYISEGDLTVKGGTLNVLAGAISSNGIVLYNGQMKVQDNANIAVVKTSVGHSSMARNSLVDGLGVPTNQAIYAVFARNGVEITGGKLLITDSGAVSWENPSGSYKGIKYNKIINVVPTWAGIDAKDAVAVMAGTKADGSDAATPAEALAAATIAEYRYLSFTYVCGEHAYDGDADLICNKCGEKRACPGHTGGTATCTQQAVCDICGEGYGALKDHEYDNEYDGICNVCGEETRDVAEDITIKVVTTDKGMNTIPKDDEEKYIREVTVKPGEVYYAVADDTTGFVTFFGKAETAPDGWDFMVDNTKVVAELIFDNDAYLRKDGEAKTRLEDENGNAVLNANGAEQYTVAQKLLKVTGEGALKVTVRSNTKLDSYYDVNFVINMGEGTTIISESNSLLTVLQDGANGTSALDVTGDLTLDHANIVATTKRGDTFWRSGYLMKVTGDMEIIGGRLDMAALNNQYTNASRTNGNTMLTVGGALTLSDYAWVNIHMDTTHTDIFYGNAARALYRYGVNATSITINNSSLYIIDNDVLSPEFSNTYSNVSYTIAEHTGMLDYAINKWPTLTGVQAYYSNNVDGTERETLTANTESQLVYGPAGAIEFPYVAFIADCPNGEHSGGTATCTEKAICEYCNNYYGELGDHVAEDDGDCLTEDVCTVCGEVATEAKEAHDYAYNDNKDGATHLVTCKNCEAVTNSESHVDEDENSECDKCGAALACKHKNTEVLEAVAATCTTPGKTEGLKCSDCNEILTPQQDTEIDANNHVEIKQVDAKPATCTENGHNAYEYCTSCDYTTVEVIPATNHANKYEVEGYAATCTEAGKTDGVYCPDCETWLEPQQEIPATNEHDYSVFVETVAPDFGVQGYDVYRCATCELTTQKNPTDALVAVAQNATTGAQYVTLQAAIDAAAAGQTVTLLADLDLGTGCIVVDGKTVTLDLAGNTLTGNGCDGVIYACGGANVTITGNGAIVAKEGISATELGNTNGTEYDYAMVVYAYGENTVVTIENGTFSNENKDGESQEDMIYVKAGATINIEGGTFECATPKWTLNVRNDAPGTINVTGGKFLGFDPAEGDDVLEGSFIAADKHTAVDNDGYYAICNGEYEGVATAPNCTEDGYTVYTCAVCGDTYTVVDEGSKLGHNHVETYTDPTFEADGYWTYTCSCGDTYTVADEGSMKIAVAQVGDDKFETLQAAIDAADGKTVKLLTSIDMKGVRVNITTNCTLDLNGNVLTSKDGGEGNWMAIYVNDGKTFILDDTAEGGMVVSSCYGIYVKAGATFIMNGGTLKVSGNGTYDIGVITWNADFVMNGGIIEARIGVMASDYYEADASTITINDGAINIDGRVGAQGDASVALIVDAKYPKGATISVLGGSFNSDVSEYIPADKHMAENDGIYTICTGSAQDAVEKNRVEADCTTDGSYDLVVYCTCGKELSRVTETIEATGHTAGDWTVTKEATCTETGSRERFCSVCGQNKETEEIPVVDHVFSVHVKTVKPTDKARGYSIYKCENCDETEVCDVVAALTDAVAEFEGEYYNTLAEALLAAKESTSDDKVITMVRKQVGAALVIDTNVTIDFNGLTYTVDTVNENGAAIVIAAEVTLKNGTIQVRHTEKALFNYLIVNNGTLTTQNITLRGDNLSAAGETATIVNNGTLDLQSGTVVNAAKTGLVATANVTKDASVELEAPANFDWENGTTLVVHNHSHEIEKVVEADFTQSGYTRYTCKCGHSYIDNIVPNLVAYAENVTTHKLYTTLAEAVAEAGDGETVKLLKKQVGAALVINADITINLDGKTYTVNEHEGGAAIVVAAGVEAKITNGMVQIRFTSRKNFNCLVNNEGTLKVDSTVTLNAANAQAEGAVAFKGNPVTVEP